MNIQQIIQAATLKGANSNKLTESISKAKELLDSVNRPEESLSKINIDPGFIQTLRSYIDNPMFSWIFPMLKRSKEEVKRGLDKAEEYLQNKKRSTNEFETFTPNVLVSNDSGRNNIVDNELEKFRKALSQLK